MSTRLNLKPVSDDIAQRIYEQNATWRSRKRPRTFCQRLAQGQLALYKG